VLADSEPVTGKSGVLLYFVTLLIVMAGLVPVHTMWIAQIALIILLFTVPGALLLRAFRVPRDAISAFPLYVPGASLVVLIGCGLLVDVIGPRLGVTQPLRALPLLGCLEVICGVLLWLGRNCDEEMYIAVPRLGRSAWYCSTLFVPLVAAIGALRLNNGHDATVAVLAIVLSIALLIWALYSAPGLGTGTLALILFAIALAATWSFSLRSDLVYGFDISSEYNGMQDTIQAGVWHLSHAGNAYAAMLSITILPAELHAISGITGLMLLKLVYPVVNALFPVGVFSLGRKVLSRRWAFVAAIFVIIQQPFSQEMPALARQEIALCLFLAMLGAIFDQRISRNAQWTLTALFAAGGVVSHYSTTYFSLFMLAPVLPLQFIVSRFRKIPAISGVIAIAFVVSLAGAYVWDGVITHSSQNVSQFVQEAGSQGFDLLPNRRPGQSLISSYLQGTGAVALSPAVYEKLAGASYAKYDPYVHPLPASDQARFPLQAAPPVPTTATRLHVAKSGVNLLNEVGTQLSYLLAAVGSVVLVFRRKTAPFPRSLAMIGVGTLFALIAIRLSGSISVFYNQQRAFVQSMAILSILLCWPLQYLVARFKRLAVPIASAACVVLVSIFAASSGIEDWALGGPVDTNFASAGEDYERFYMTTPELATATWLGSVVKPGQLIYADRYAQLRLAAVTGLVQGVMGDITPATIDQQAWVYASAANIVGLGARSDFSGSGVLYAFPIYFLEQYFNTVYTDGSSEVFHR
jgi:uncharacterized membrane protein